jgi:hemerythrin-like domain-containing protein
MSTGSANRQERDVVLEEHRALLQLVGMLEEWVAPSDNVDPGWGDELARRVGNVHEGLKAHFQGAAERELFDELARTAPHLLNKLTALATEHREILEQFRHVGDQARSLDLADLAAVERLSVLTQCAIALLRRHEAEENELIVQAIWEDIGAAD